jgi:hypothetical protein
MEKIVELLSKGYEVYLIPHSGTVAIRLVKPKTRSHWTGSSVVSPVDLTAALDKGVAEIETNEQRQKQPQATG